MYTNRSLYTAMVLLAASSGLCAQTTSTSDQPVLEEVVVTGVRASEQQSVELKRDAASIQDSIAAEDIGKLPDRTIADSLQRITGVQINREGGIKSLGGARLKPIVADTTTENPTQGASVARRIIDQDHAVALFGSTASAITLATQVEAEKSQVPLVTSSYADPLVQRGMKYTFKITTPGSYSWNFAMDALVEMIKTERGSPPKS